MSVVSRLITQVNKRPYLTILLGALVLFGLYLTSRHSYLLFHSLAEIFAVVVSFGIFVLTWNSRRFIDNNYILFLGIAYLFTGTLDLVHTLAYKGMGVFPGYGSNPATQLWIAARYLQSVSFLVAPLLIGRKLRPPFVFLGYIVVTSLLFMSIFYWHNFPVCYVDGVGLTTFKKISEYVISFVFLASIFLLYRKRREFDTSVFRFLVASIVVTIGSELAFTLYTGPYTLPNMIGHLLKIVAVYFMYRAIIWTGLAKPYNLVFRNLKQSEEALRESEANYRMLVESSPDGVISVNDKVRIIDCNEGVCQLLGYPREELRGKDFRELLASALPDKLSAYYDQLSRNGLVETEFELLGRGGRKIPVWAKIVGHHDVNGRLSQALVYIRDIAERKKLDQLKDEFIGPGLS